MQHVATLFHGRALRNRRGQERDICMRLANLLVCHGGLEQHAASSEGFRFVVFLLGEGARLGVRARIRMRISLRIRIGARVGISTRVRVGARVRERHRHRHRRSRKEEKELKELKELIKSPLNPTAPKMPDFLRLALAPPPLGEYPRIRVPSPWPSKPSLSPAKEQTYRNVPLGLPLFGPTTYRLEVRAARICPRGF